MIYELKEAGYIVNSKKISSPNIKVVFIDDTSDEILKITDMRELGYQYMETLPKTPIRRCLKCGKPYKLKSKNSRAGLCPDCQKKEMSDNFKIKHCEICGKEFLCSPLASKTYLCPQHQEKITREKKTREMRKLRKNQ